MTIKIEKELLNNDIEYIDKIIDYIIQETKKYIEIDIIGLLRHIENQDKCKDAINKIIQGNTDPESAIL